MSYAKKRGREIALKHARPADMADASDALEKAGDLYVAGVADRLREQPGITLLEAMEDEHSRWACREEEQRFLDKQDLAWFTRLESEATTDEQREFARQWREEMERRLR